MMNNGLCDNVVNFFSYLCQNKNIVSKEDLEKIKLGKISNVFLAKDCNSTVREKILNYKKKSKLDVVELEINSAEIGALCKKQFSISVLSY